MARTTRSITRLVAAALAALTLAACGGDDGSTGPGPGPAPSQAKLVIKNASSLTIAVVRFSDCSDVSWGPNRLGANETIAAGGQRSWDVTPGCYDIRAEATTGSKVEWMDRQLAAGQTREFTAGQLSASVAPAGARKY